MLCVDHLTACDKKIVGPQFCILPRNKLSVFTHSVFMATLEHTTVNKENWLYILVKWLLNALHHVKNCERWENYMYLYIKQSAQSCGMHKSNWKLWNRRHWNVVKVRQGRTYDTNMSRCRDHNGHWWYVNIITEMKRSNKEV